MQLPDAFRTQIKQHYPDRYESLEVCYQKPAIRAVRLQKFATSAGTASSYPETGSHPSVNNSPWLVAGTLPAPPESIRKMFGEPIPWYDEAYYIGADSPLGRTVAHELGGVYIQEASAMAAVAALHPEPGERVLDLCGAPGSKATAIGRRLRGQTPLYANEIHPTRVKILAQNLERAGIPACITNNSPAELAATWGPVFDAVLVDAPCSGEGMFRKDPDAIAEWSLDSVDLCASRQRDILGDAVRLVKPGGRLVYSTCTLNPLENEQVVAWACAHLPVEVDPLPDWPGWEPGRPHLAGDVAEIAGTRRLWPDSDLGEGHFVARFRVLDTALGNLTSHSRPSRRKTPHKTNPAARHGTVGSLDWKGLLSDLVHADSLLELIDEPVLRGNSLLLATNRDLPTDGLRVIRDGICLAQGEHSRLVPHHQFAQALQPRFWLQHRTLEPDEALAFLAGETLSQSGAAGFVALSYQGLPAGLGKAVPGRLNNLYPKGLRRANLIAD